ncbi:MAG: phosphoribosylglycinamide formyltransferase [Magnetococcales bacterium]|nr:phosphoribosylglycinamide formyltransferase [Magnetococcales bacterium]
MADPSFRYGVLISGGGSNLQALIDRSADGYIPGRIAVVISNEPRALGVQRAVSAGIATRVIDHREFPDRAAFEKAMADTLDAAQVELVCLAGFMRVLTPWFVRRYQGRLLNIHPALLPAFPGLHVQEKALTSGVRFSGATVHFVTEEIDTGPIVAQAVVPILPGDDVPTLASRILRQEHRLYPLAVRLFAQKRLLLHGRQVVVADHAVDPDAALINPPLEPIA